MPAYRIERINSLIRDELSEMLQRRVKDPRLGGMIEITGVVTAGDLRNAHVYVSSIETEPDKKAILNGLHSASGYFRTELAKRLKMRHTPELSFSWDDSIERGSRILEIIDKVAGENSDKPAP
jgi:ribosome-binding factor A